MYPQNLAIVFGPNILQPAQVDPTSFALAMDNLGRTQGIVRFLIVHCDELFNDDLQHITGVPLET